eukprot:688458-Prorocentrum_minimum.AAC.1
MVTGLSARSALLMPSQSSRTCPPHQRHISATSAERGAALAPRRPRRTPLISIWCVLVLLVVFLASRTDDLRASHHQPHGGLHPPDGHVLQESVDTRIAR